MESKKESARKPYTNIGSRREKVDVEREWTERGRVRIEAVRGRGGGGIGGGGAGGEYIDTVLEGTADTLRRWASDASIFRVAICSRKGFRGGRPINAKVSGSVSSMWKLAYLVIRQGGLVQRLEEVGPRIGRMQCHTFDRAW